MCSHQDNQFMPIIIRTKSISTVPLFCPVLIILFTLYSIILQPNNIWSKLLFTYFYIYGINNHITSLYNLMIMISLTTRLQTTQHTRGGAVKVVWQTLCKFCRSLPPPAMGARLPFLGGASQSCGPTGWLVLLLIKAGDVETNPGPTNTRKQIRICDICHRQIQVRK